MAGHQRVHEEVPCVDLTPAVAAGEHHGRIQTQGGSGRLGTRVRVGNAATEGAAVADCARPGPVQRLRQQGGSACDFGCVLHGNLPRHGTEAQDCAVQYDVRQPGAAVQVDQHGGASHAHHQQRHHALPASEHACRIAVFGQQVERSFDRGGSRVPQGRWFHVRMVFARSPSTPR